jgi:hypothetical protein
MYFKMFIDGHHITSWGGSTASGSVRRGLYKPGEQWHQVQNGLTLREDGIEARYFHFTAPPENTSIAGYGGTIEVHAFRASARKRRAAELEPWHNLELHGVA